MAQLEALPSHDQEQPKDRNLYTKPPFSPLMEAATEQHGTDLVVARRVLSSLVVRYDKARHLARLTEDLTHRGFVRHRTVGEMYVAEYIKSQLRRPENGLERPYPYDEYLATMVGIGQGLAPFEHWATYLQKHLGRGRRDRDSADFALNGDPTPAFPFTPQPYEVYIAHLNGISGNPEEGLADVLPNGYAKYGSVARVQSGKNPQGPPGGSGTGMRIIRDLGR